MNWYDDLYGYEPKTTFWQDFSIAEHFGNSAIKDTFERAFRGWKDNYEYLTELVLVLNHKLWQWYGIANEQAEREQCALIRSKLYNELWIKADNYACNNLQGKELSYFYNVTD